MKKLLFLLPLCILADVNPFGAGLNSKTPYGLTPQEKAILQNKKEISKLKLQIDDINNQLNQMKLKLSNYDDLINQKLSGFSTVLDEIKLEKENIKNLQKNSDLQNQEIEKINKKIESLESNLTAIKQSLKEITKIQNQNFNTLKEAIKQILNTMNQNKPLSVKEAFVKAKKYFYENKLNKAKPLFLYSLQNNHLPATSAYYLGEIEYKQGHFKKALAYYKKSVSLYPKKTSFTDRLLYHTAISFLNLGERQKAKLTLKKIVNDFPTTKYGILAKKELEKLK